MRFLRVAALLLIIALVLTACGGDATPTAQAILQFLSRWGELLWPVIVMRGDDFHLLPVAMQTFFGQQPSQWGDLMAFAALVTIPVLVLFLVFQRWFVQSITSTEVKG